MNSINQSENKKKKHSKIHHFFPYVNSNVNAIFI